MFSPDVKVAYVLGYLEATLGSPTLEIPDDVRERIQHAVNVLRENTSDPGPQSQAPTSQVLQ